MNKYRIILFDLDDTLVNSKEASKDVFFDIAIAKGYKMNDEIYQQYLEYDDNFWKLYWKDFDLGKRKIPDNYVTNNQVSDYLRSLRFKEFFDGMNMEEAFEFNNLYNTNHNHYKAISGAKELIHDLYNKGYLLYIATNGPEDLAKIKLNIIGITDYINEIFSYEKLGYSKPNSKFFEAVFKELNYPKKDEVLLVGDSLVNDVIGGNEFGIDTCWFNPTNDTLPSDVKPSLIIEKLIELVDIV